MEINSNLQKSRLSLDSALVLKNGAGTSWRPSSFLNIASDILRRNNPVLESLTPTDNTKIIRESPPEPPIDPPNNEKLKTEATVKKDTRVRNTIVNIVIVEAKGLPASPGDGSSHGVYCKIRLGTQIQKSKTVMITRQPQWREQFKLNLSNDQLLTISLWDKGKQKNFMGSCVLDLSSRERERTHEIWQELDGGYGSIHLSVTMCSTRNTEDVPSTVSNIGDLASKYAFYNFSTNIKVVGQLHVKVIGARGLNGKPNAYCTLELDNEKVLTPSVSSNAEPVWNKTYVFNIFDVTSTLELKVTDCSLNSLLSSFLGRVTIPLLRINNGEARWYALKDNHNRKSAKGNCPRVRLEMNIYWNPVTASLKLFRPKQVKYMAKHPKFDVALVYKNLKFIRDTFDFLYRINESFKDYWEAYVEQWMFTGFDVLYMCQYECEENKMCRLLFEWNDRQYSTTVLLIWLVFWYFFDPWMTPLVIAVLFPIIWVIDKKQHENAEDHIEQGNDDSHNGKSITGKIKGLPEMTFAITDGIEYMVSVAERIQNLATFKVPFLTYLTILLLIITSGILFFIPFKYQMMAFGLYKFVRKRFDPDRVLNNDLLDFISRIPDNKILKDWKVLSVPEPNQQSKSESIPVISGAT